MIENAKRNQSLLNQNLELLGSSRPAVSISDGCRRWLEDEQIVEFVEPEFKGKNAMFHVKGQSGQSIWYTQLSQVAMDEDLKTPMYSTIKFKDGRLLQIADNFRNGSDFWKAIRGKQFRVSIIGAGFIVNTKSENYSKLISETPSLQAITESSSKKVFDYILSAIEQNKVYCKGLIKNYTIYSLTEL